MIPKIIWQTYKTPTPPKLSADCINSWLTLNPDYKWYYFDDEKCQQFIQDYYDDEFVKMYESLPIGVMKADVWRIAVVYVYGGIYADLDTRCLVPANQWISDNDSLVVGVETPHGAINNYIFAAEPKHPALYSVLENLINIYNSPEYLDKNSKTPVQDFGANAWSSGILKHYNLCDTESMSKGGDYYNTVDKVQEEKTKFFSYKSKAFTFKMTPQTLVHHQTGSIWWRDGYESWRLEQKQKFGVFD